jgi:DNA-directed RNA polymerase specialized sigma24 family protein
MLVGIDRGTRPPCSEEAEVDSQEERRGDAGNAGEAAGAGCDVGLVAIMQRLAAGDDAAVVTLYERHGGSIAGAVRRVARRRGWWVDRDELDGLVLEVCFELRRVADRWSPDGGALPWVWARHRVANVVDRVLGQWAEPLDERRIAHLEQQPAAGTAAVGEGSMLDALGRLVPDLASAELLAEALDRERISHRDRELLFEYSYEKHSGNVSPATTVAPVFGMKEATVRQAFRRARQRLLRLAATDERFAPLADLPLLA